MFKKVLVTGGCGFMGSNFIRTLMAARPDVQVVNLDLLTYAGNPENLAGIDESRYTFVRGDIADAALVSRLFKDVDAVVNFAAETHVDRSIHVGADAFVHTNILGVQTLLEALRAAPNVKRFVQISTDEVYGDLPLASKERFTEESPFKPNSPYAASKAAADLLIRAYVRTYGVPVIVTHAVNNYGPRQFPEKLIPFFVMRALADQPLPLYGKGENMRDWLHVDDHSAALLTILEHGELGEVYNISEQEEYTNKTIADRILEVLGKPSSLITYVTDRPGHDLKYAVDSSKLRALGWKPEHDLAAALPEVIKWFEASARKMPEGVNSHIAVPAKP